VADAAHNGKGPPPIFEMSLMGLCKQFQCTPSEILEEDADMIIKMMVFENTYNAISKARRAKGDEIHKLPPAYGRIIEELMESGVYKGGLNNG
jgi:hypothetical protein